MSESHDSPHSADRPAAAPPPNLAQCAAKLADFFTGPASEFHSVLAQLVHRGEVRYEIQAPDGSLLELTLSDPTVNA